MRIDTRTFLFALATFLLSISMLREAAAQPGKGYFITNDGSQSDGFIRVNTMDMRDSPDRFSFKPSKDADFEDVDPNSVKELGLPDGTVFQRLTVDMDRFPSNLDQFSIHLERWERNPTMKTETLFLRLLVDGKARLYAYDEGTLHRFFFAVGDAPVKQLVSKRYFNKNQDILVNEAYKQALFNELKCEAITQKHITSTRYEQKDFVKLFTLYNNCASKTP